MTAAAHKMEEDDDRWRASARDIVSGEVMPENRLIRFVADPDGSVVPDAAAKLPGRGLWVEASQSRHRQGGGEETVLPRRQGAGHRHRRSGRPRRKGAGGAHDRRSGPGAPLRRAGAGLRQCAARAGRPQAAQGADRGVRRRRRRQAQTVRRRAPAGTELRGDRMPDQRRIGLGAGTRECDTCRRPAGRSGRTFDL